VEEDRAVKVQTWTLGRDWRPKHMNGRGHFPFVGWDDGGKDVRSRSRLWGKVLHRKQTLSLVRCSMNLLVEWWGPAGLGLRAVAPDCS
jgi:hypothetical protein